MYGINIFDKIKMPLDWSIVYYGINNNILSIDIAKEFACRKLEHNEQMSEEELELSWNSINRLDVLELIKKILYNQKNSVENLEQAKEKICLAIIINLRDSEKNVSALLEKINVIYADFDYPQDMEQFVSYMPINNESIATNYTLEDRQNKLLYKLDIFINEQMKKYQLNSR